MKKILKISICAVMALLLTASLAACAPKMSDTVVNESPKAVAEPEKAVVSQPSDPDDKTAVTVSASASVSLVPDMATLSFGVTTEERTAEEAQRKNSEAVARVTDVLKQHGVEENSIRTSGYNMYPQYDYTEKGEERITGYSVYVTMTVSDQKIEDLGKILSACVEAGINRIDSVRFLCSGYDEAYVQALADAVGVARGKAQILAAAAGRKLGEAVTVTEGWQDTSSRYGQSMNSSFDMPAADAEMAKGAIPTFSPGETEITANVTVTFRME